MGHRFLVNKISDNKAEIRGSDYAHAITVLRLKQGDSVTVFNYEHGEYEATVENIDRQESVMTVAVKKQLRQRARRAAKIGAIISMIKKDKMEFVIEKMTELGVDYILPVTAKRSVALIKEEAKKKERWEKIVYTAVKQCGRLSAPVIMDHADSVAKIEVSGARFFVYEKADEKFLFDEVRLSADSGSMTEFWFIIGPEGGFDIEEADILINKGFIPVSLGDTILRAETAAIASASSVVQALRRSSWTQQPE